MDRLSYARVLVEVDIMKELKQSTTIQLPNGTSLCQFVIYETLPTHCKNCKVLNHGTAVCKHRGKGDGQQEERQSVFNRLGPMPVLEDSDAGIMFPETAVDENGWEMVRSKRNQKRKGAAQGKDAHVRAANSRVAAATDSHARPAAKGISASLSANIATGLVGITEEEDPAVVCAALAPSNDHHAEVQYNSAINLEPVTETTRDTGSLSGFAADLEATPTLPAERVPLKIAVGAGKTVSAIVGTSDASVPETSSAAPPVINEAGIEAATSRENVSKYVDARTTTLPGLLPNVAANTVKGLRHPAGISEINCSNFFQVSVEDEMRGVLMGQGSLGSPFAGAARLGGQIPRLPERGNVGDTVPPLTRTDSVQIGGVSVHRIESGKGAGEPREVGQRSEQGVLTRSGRRRSRGGGKNPPPTKTA